jgi:hypothetical protein
MYAMIIAAQVRDNGGSSVPAESLKVPPLSSESLELLNRILAGDQDASRGGKLRMLNPVSRNLILDQLIQKAEVVVVTEALMQIAASPLLSNDEQRVIVDRAAWRISMFGNPYSKAALLKGVSPELFASLPTEVRAAFYEDVIVCIEANQYDSVNELVPSLQHHLNAVPPELHSRFAHALLRQSQSDAWRAAPAARRMLTILPLEIARAGVNLIDVDYLLRYGYRPEVRRFVESNVHLAMGELATVLADFINLSERQFVEQYGIE